MAQTETPTLKFQYGGLRLDFTWHLSKLSVHVITCIPGHKWLVWSLHPTNAVIIIHF